MCKFNEVSNVLGIYFRTQLMAIKKNLDNKAKLNRKRHSPTMIWYPRTARINSVAKQNALAFNKLYIYEYSAVL